MSMLKSFQKYVISLRDKGMTYKEIEEILSLNRATIKKLELGNDIELPVKSLEGAANYEEMSVPAFIHHISGVKIEESKGFAKSQPIRGIAPDLWFNQIMSKINNFDEKQLIELDIAVENLVLDKSPKIIEHMIYIEERYRELRILSSKEAI